MLRDYSLPECCVPAEVVEAPVGGRIVASARWTAKTLGSLARHLAGRPAVVAGELEHEMGRLRLADAWEAAVQELRDPDSPTRRALDAPLAGSVRLSPPGLAAGLEAVLGGVSGDSARAVFEEAAAEPAEPGLVLVVLAANLPALAVQPLLPALALGCPVLVKSASAEPLFAPCWVDSLCAREPGLRSRLAAVTWPGGDHELERAILPYARRVLAYGDAATMADLRERVGSRLVARGPKLSLALLGADADPSRVAAGLASDIALFEQRGCLSIQAIFTAGESETLARELARALEDRHRAWPPGAIDPWLAGHVQELRTEGIMRGLFQPSLDLEAGTVLVDPVPELRPSPGLRTVRIHPVETLEEVPRMLAPWEGRLQGAALGGASAWALEESLRGLGCTRLAVPGELQAADATWHNGGVSPLEALR